MLGKSTELDFCPCPNALEGGRFNNRIKSDSTTIGGDIGYPRQASRTLAAGEMDPALAVLAMLFPSFLLQASASFMLIDFWFKTKSSKLWNMHSAPRAVGVRLRCVCVHIGVIHLQTM